MTTSLPPASRRDGAAGFLLTETLATFVISAFVLLGLVSASSVLLRNVDHSVAQIENVDDLAQTMQAIRRDISGLARARWNGDEPQDFVFTGGPNSLYFAHAQRELDGLRETSVVALREVISGRTTRLMRGEAHLAAQAKTFDDLHYAAQRELGTGAARLRFFYERAVANKAEVALSKDWRGARFLPTAIIVEAVARDTGKPIVSMRVPIHADADIGCLEHDESREDAAPPPPGSMAALDAAVAASGSGTSKEEAHSFCGRETKQDPTKPADQAGQPPVPSPRSTP